MKFEEDSTTKTLLVIANLERKIKYEPRKSLPC